MKVIVHGCTGRMGQVIIDLCNKGFAGGSFAAGVSPDVVKEEGNLHQVFETCTEEADVVIDFSFHTATAGLLEFCKARKLPVVVATTAHTPEEKALIEEASKVIPVFYTFNMSLGIAVLADLAKRAALAFPGANIEIVEAHHNQKLDVPSGTAIMLANAIHEVRPESWNNVGRHENGKRTDDEIGIHSLRIGNVVGMHEVMISTGNETITLKHEASSRALFGEGAMRAAAFLVGKEPGLYKMSDIIG